MAYRGPVWFLFLKTVLRTIFENIENTILVFSKNCSCSLNLVFSMFSMFFRTKKIGNRKRSPCFPCF